MDDSIFGFVSIIVLGCGIYSLYAYIKMRQDGHINETLLLGKGYMEYQCKDKEAYMKKAMPAVLLFGIVSTVYGIIDTVHYYVKPLGMADTIATVVFLIVLVGFMMYTLKLKKQYF